MTKRLDVGRSERTPAKHALMCSWYGQEVGAINCNRFRDISRLSWIDLTAGDGVTDPGVAWHRNCSPGINAYYATHSVKPVDVTLYEIKPATFERLLGSLADHLPALGYERLTETDWVFGDRVTLHAVPGSGWDASVSDIRRTDAVLVSNDPNAITDWAMRPTFAAELAGRVRLARFISTMGCNTAGLKRLDLELRLRWYELIQQQVQALPRYRDLILAAIDGDVSQWAYLLCEPAKWQAKTQAVIRTAFGRHGYKMETAWHRSAPAEFAALTHRLFLTRNEREAS